MVKKKRKPLDHYVDNFVAFKSIGKSGWNHGFCSSTGQRFIIVKPFGLSGEVVVKSKGRKIVIFQGSKLITELRIVEVPNN